MRFHALQRALRPLFFLLGVLSLADAATVVSYSESQVWDYLRNLDRGNVSTKCASSLDRVENYLTDSRTLPEERKWFFESYGSGDATQFTSRDQDRWIYRAFECLKAAGETSYSASQYPLHYCYGFNDDHRQTAYGVCIPSTCANDHQSLLKSWQSVISKGEDRLPLDYEDCTKSRHEHQWYQLPIPLMHFASDIVLFAIIGIATIYHVKRGDKSKSMAAQLLLAFSFKRNAPKLIQMPKDAFIENVDEFKDDLVDNFWNQWITNFTLSVDVFLTLSGCLTAFSWFKKWQKNTTGKFLSVVPFQSYKRVSEEEPGWTSWGYWLRFYRHRVVRLWPAYLYTLLAVTTRVSITHFHPMWPPTDPAVQCPKHWVENVLFINSLTDNRCMPWTWYIGTEFIFYLLAPIFLLSLRRNPTLGLLLSTAVILVSSILNVITMVNYNFPPTQLLWKQPDIFTPDYILHHLVIYIKPWYRIGPYIVGLLLGYHLAGFQSQTQKKSRSTRFVVVGWALATIAGFWALYGLYPSLQGYHWPFYHLFYGATHRTVFSLALGWLIYACHTGIGGPFNAILSMRALLPLSSLSYSAYLIHMIPVVFTYLIQQFPLVYTTKWTLFVHCLVQLGISYLFGFMCTMMAEMPALNIERLLLTRKPKSAMKPLPAAADCELQLKPNGAEAPLSPTPAQQPPM
ncbi:Nose resistant to fluoxetine protein 6 [Aphelenchoides fujianensis]|nr:Nose resistant to fluoxetine protein 6 [Aphelenchoides fujianensis]